jgi:hypothetical protein
VNPAQVDYRAPQPAYEAAERALRGLGYTGDVAHDARLAIDAATPLIAQAWDSGYGRHHRQVRVTDDRGFYLAMADEGLAPMLLDLHRLGFDTTASCQGGYGLGVDGHDYDCGDGYVAFTGFTMATRFWSLVRLGGFDTTPEQPVRDALVHSGREVMGKWPPVGSFVNERWFTGAHLEPYCSVARFPADTLPGLTAAVHVALERHYSTAQVAP